MSEKRRILLRIEGCPYCRRADEALTEAKIPFERLDVDPYDRTIVEKLSGQPSVPILVEVIGSSQQDDDIIDYIAQLTKG